MKYKAVLFDMDEVILDSERLHIAAFQATLAVYGHALAENEYKAHFAGRTDEAGFKLYFDHIGETVDLSMIMGIKAQKYVDLASDRLVPYSGIIDLIRSLKRNVPLALVTGSLRAEAEIVLETFGVTDCFKLIIAAEDITRSKPDPEGYLKASKSLGIQPAQCVVIEDSPNGVQAALAAQMECIAITTTHTADDLVGATRVVTRLELSNFMS